MKACPTVYKGIEYRSRLEARWAVFFEQIGWRTTYEPLDGDRYIPDLVVDGPRPLLVAIKPATLVTDYLREVPKIETCLRGHWERDAMIVGLNPVPGQIDGTAAADSRFHPPAGVLGEFFDGWLTDGTGAKSGWSWDNLALVKPEKAVASDVSVMHAKRVSVEVKDSEG